MYFHLKCRIMKYFIHMTALIWAKYSMNLPLSVVCAPLHPPCPNTFSL